MEKQIEKCNLHKLLFWISDVKQLNHMNKKNQPVNFSQ